MAKVWIKTSDESDEPFVHFAYVETPTIENIAVGGVSVHPQGKITWVAGDNNLGSADSVEDAKRAVETLWDKGESNG